VLAIPISLPGLSRPWALPVVCALYLSVEENRKRGRRHKTSGALMRQRLCVLLRWFPLQNFVFSGNSGPGTHVLARLASGQPRLTLISNVDKDANLYDPPPQRPPAPTHATGTPHAGTLKDNVELSWRYQFHRSRIRYERRADIHQAFLTLGGIPICYRFLPESFC